MPSSKTRLAVLDTSVYIEHFRSGRFADQIVRSLLVPRCSAVVLHELMRGARTRLEVRFVKDLARKCRVVTPTAGEWLRAGEVLKAIRRDEGCDAGRIRELAFDTLIALTARGIGATVVTCDAADFALIRRYVPFDVVYWA